MESETFRKKVEDQGAFAAYMNPVALGKFAEQESALWAQVIKEGNIKAD